MGMVFAISLVSNFLPRNGELKASPLSFCTLILEIPYHYSTFIPISSVGKSGKQANSPGLCYWNTLLEEGC